MNDDGLTLEELKQAMREGRALVAHFVEIQTRVFELLKRLREARERGEVVAPGAETTKTIERLAADAASLVGYLQLMLDENDRLVAYLIGLEEAGTISRQELDFLMGLRRASRPRAPCRADRGVEDGPES